MEGLDSPVHGISDGVRLMVLFAWGLTLWWFSKASLGKLSASSPHRAACSSIRLCFPGHNGLYLIQKSLPLSGLPGRDLLVVTKSDLLAAHETCLLLLQRSQGNFRGDWSWFSVPPYMVFSVIAWA